MFNTDRLLNNCIIFPNFANNTNIKQSISKIKSTNHETTNDILQ